MNQEKLDNVLGNSFEELGEEDMQQIQGAGDVGAETVVPVIVTVATAASIVYSAKKC